MTTKKEDVVQALYKMVNFEPTIAQTPILTSKKRYILVAGGEQAGKSMIASKYLLSRVFETETPGLYWLVAADYERTRAEYEYLVDDFEKLGVLKKASKRVDPGTIELVDGTKIQTKSAKDPRTLAMRAPNGIIGCEASQLDLETFHRLLGRCAPRKAWMFLGGTFEGSLGWYPQMFQTWQYGEDDSQSYSLPSYTNKHLYPGGENDEQILKLQRMTSDDFFKERIQGIPSPPQGLVFPEFRPDTHVQEVDYIPGEPVHIWMDPGYAGAYAVCAVQIINDKVIVFDEIYEQNLITEEIIDIAMQRNWWIDVQFGVIDVAGYQHQAMAAPAEVWLDKAGLYMDSEKIKINDGTERFKSMLKLDPSTHEPKIIINARCKGLLSELGYAPNPFNGQTQVYKWKTDRDGNVVGNQPEDKYNHSVKALIYGLVNRFGYSYLATRNSIPVRRWR
tara:strand:- start:2887 stop:4230 length:1344 start_codon:yes stop_codon:yes gene_type:complete